MARLGEHPRLAAMLLQAQAQGVASLGCLLAGLVAEGGSVLPREERLSADVSVPLAALLFHSQQPPEGVAASFPFPVIIRPGCMKESTPVQLILCDMQLHWQISLSVIAAVCYRGNGCAGVRDRQLLAAVLRTAEQLLAALQALESSPGSQAGSSAAHTVHAEGTLPAALAQASGLLAQEQHLAAPRHQLGMPDEAQQRALSAFLSRRLAPGGRRGMGGNPSAGDGSHPTGVQESSGAADGSDESVVELLTGPTLGVLLACAYPERIAQRQNRGGRQGFNLPRKLTCVHYHPVTPVGAYLPPGYLEHQLRPCVGIETPTSWQAGRLCACLSRGTLWPRRLTWPSPTLAPPVVATGVSAVLATCQKHGRGIETECPPEPHTQLAQSLSAGKAVCKTLSQLGDCEEQYPLLWEQHVSGYTEARL